MEDIHAAKIVTSVRPVARSIATVESPPLGSTLSGKESCSNSIRY